MSNPTLKFIVDGTNRLESNADDNETHKIKIIKDSVSGDIYNYKIYVYDDGNQLIINGDIPIQGKKIEEVDLKIVYTYDQEDDKKKIYEFINANGGEELGIPKNIIFDKPTTGYTTKNITFNNNCIGDLNVNFNIDLTNLNIEGHVTNLNINEDVTNLDIRDYITTLNINGNVTNLNIRDDITTLNINGSVTNLYIGDYRTNLNFISNSTEIKIIGDVINFNFKSTTTELTISGDIRELNFKGDITNLNIKENITNLNIEGNVTLNLETYISQININSGTTTFGKHTVHNFDLANPPTTDLSGHDITKGENYIYNLTVKQGASIKGQTININGSKTQNILCIGKNHAYDSTSQTPLKDENNCDVKIYGTFKNVINFFIGCTSYFADYRFLLDKMKFSNGKFQDITNDDGSSDYNKHLTRLNKITVISESNTTTISHFYIGCMMLINKRFINEYDNNVNDLEIDEIEVNLGKLNKKGYIPDIFCGLVDHYNIPNSDTETDGKNWDVNKDYLSNKSKEYTMKTKINKIYIHDSKYSNLSVGGTLWNSNFNIRNQMLTYSAISVNNCDQEKVDIVDVENLKDCKILSCVSTPPNEKYNKTITIDFDKVEITKNIFNNRFYFLHCFKNVNINKKNSTAIYKNNYCIDLDNKIYFPCCHTYSDNTEYLFIQEQCDTDVAQNICIEGDKSFQKWKMRYEFYEGSYNFIPSECGHLDSDNEFKFYGVEVRVPEPPGYKAFLKSSQTKSEINPKITHDPGDLKPEQLMQVYSDFSNIEKFNLSFKVPWKPKPSPYVPDDPDPKPKEPTPLKILKLLAIIYLLSDDAEEFIDIVILLIIKYYDIAQNLYYHIPKKYFAYINFVLNLYLASFAKYLDF